MPDIKTIKDNSEKELLKKKGVVSVGIGLKKVNGKLTTETAIICGVKKKVALESLNTEDIIPKEINGTKTDVIETGEIKALLLRTDKIRPAVRGISIGHYQITAGTLGMIVNKNGYPYILSNNHVLANSNAGTIGDTILQQGSYDGGVIGNNTIGTLYDYVPILFDGETPPIPPPSTCSIANTYTKIGNFISNILGRKSRFSTYTQVPTENRVDSAICKPTSSNDITLNSYENWGPITGTNSVYIGDTVRKSGRTTGTTQGIVSQINVTAKISYGTNKTATFIDQFIVETNDNTKFSAGGDSGSIIQLSNNSEAVGLLFAGSDTVTVCNRIENVFSALNITM